MSSSTSSSKNLYKLLLFALLITGVCYTLHAWFDHRYQEETLYKTQWIFQKQQQQYDYLLLGSSRSYNGLDVARIDSNTGMHGLNISLDGSMISTQALILDVFLNRLGNRSKYLVVQADYWNVDMEGTTDIADSRMLPYMSWDEVYDHYKQYGMKWQAYRYIPYWKYAEYNYYWGPHILLNSYLHFQSPEFDTVQGSLFFPNGQFKGERKVQHVVFPDHPRLQSLLRMAETCKQHGVKLLLLTLPYAEVDGSDEAKKSIAAFHALCRKHGIEFIYMGDMLNKRYDYFYDEVHLNRHGAEVASDSLSKYLLP